MQVFLIDSDGKNIKFVINDQQYDERKLDYEVDGKIKLRALTSLKEQHGMIEIGGEDALEAKTEFVKLTSHDDVKRVLALAREFGLAPRVLTKA